jgi:hypothetical protein
MKASFSWTCMELDGGAVFARSDNIHFFTSWNARAYFRGGVMKFHIVS